MADIAKGSTVILASGGPRMTVAWLEDDDAYCEWFDDKKNAQGRKFSLASLRLDEGTDSAWGSARVTRG